ncbi:MAG: hypothetical protein R3C28_29805 [Pirellulaceae bacterium]
MLSKGEKTVLRMFEQYLMAPGKMLCFTGQILDQYRASFRKLAERDLLVQERFASGFSLTPAGYAAMKSCRVV